MKARQSCRGMMARRLARILVILDRGERVTLEQIASEFRISQRTVRRDMHAIEEAGYPVAVMDGFGGPGGEPCAWRKRRAA